MVRVCSRRRSGTWMRRLERNWTTVLAMDIGSVQCVSRSKREAVQSLTPMKVPKPSSWGRLKPREQSSGTSGPCITFTASTTQDGALNGIAKVLARRLRQNLLSMSLRVRALARLRQPLLTGRRTSRWARNSPMNEGFGGGYARRVSEGPISRTATSNGLTGPQTFMRDSKQMHRIMDHLEKEHQISGFVTGFIRAGDSTFNAGWPEESDRSSAPECVGDDNPSETGTVVPGAPIVTEPDRNWINHYTVGKVLVDQSGAATWHCAWCKLSLQVLPSSSNNPRHVHMPTDAPGRNQQSSKTIT